jgi:dihydrofolate reductase
MRKVIYSMMVSLDGFIEGPNRNLDWHIVDEELHRFVNEQQSAIDTHLYGRRMYEVMAYWETADKDPSSPEYVLEFARIWKKMSKIVFSKTLERVEGNARLVRDNIAAEITKLKAQPGKDLALGGADIASTFMQFGLIDEYRLFIHPVVLGSGTPMFRALDDKINLRLVETRTFGSGVVYLRYQRVGAGQERLHHATSG